VRGLNLADLFGRAARFVDLEWRSCRAYALRWYGGCLSLRTDGRLRKSVHYINVILRRARLYPATPVGSSACCPGGRSRFH
jgi:hypothetical protein